MKILKPGKVEQRKFVCPACGCTFLAYPADTYDDCIQCPQSGCGKIASWDYAGGELYEWPAQSDADLTERLADLICDGCVADGETVWELAEHLIAHGVTLRGVDHG